MIKKIYSYLTFSNDKYVETNLNMRAIIAQPGRARVS